MRIVLDATPLLGRRTGIGRYASHLLAELPAALVRAGVDARVDVTTWTARGGRLTALPSGVSQVGPPVPARALRAAWVRADHPTIESLVGRCDTFHGTNFVSPPTRRAHELVTVHDLTYELHRDTVSDDSLAYRGLVRRALRRGAHVLAISEAGAAAIRDFYDLPFERVTAAPLGVDAGWFAQQPIDDATRRSLGLPSRYLLFVGSLDPRKNLPRLLEAHAAARTADSSVPPLVLAGPAGREAVMPEQVGVVLTGWLDDAHLRAVVAGCTALVLPSLDEGFGLPVLEALACGRPVVVSDVPALREVADPGAFVVPPTDTDAIAAGLVAVVGAHDDEAARAARRTHARAWTWARCAETTVGAYRLTDG